MRPVEKGAPPGVFAKYQEAAPHLRQRLGDYCSYCERQIETHLAVEHVRPKSHNPALMTDWQNFLLACVNCNSAKGDTLVVIGDYLWPDLDNTLRAFEYSRGGIVQIRPGLSPGLSAKAQATIELLGLDKDPGNPGREPTYADDRWRRRQQAWVMVERYRQNLQGEDTQFVRELIVDVAISRGEFSIWWTVFVGDTDIRRRLREAFLGTHAGCFDATESPLARAGGQL